MEVNADNCKKAMISNGVNNTRGRTLTKSILINSVRQNLHSIMLFILIIILMLLPTGCKKEKQEPEPRQQSLQTRQEASKASEELKEIEESIEKIIKAMDGPAVGVKEENEEAGGEKGKTQESQGSEGKKKEGEQQGNEESQKQEGENEQGQNQNQAAKASQQKDPWSKVTPIISNLHYKWNSYMPNAVKAGANSKLIDDFGNALNSLTNTIIGKNSTNTIMAASYLYGYIPDFYSLYKTGISPEIKRIRYYARNAMLNAMTTNWEQAEHDIASLKSSWSMFKNTVPGENQEEAGKLDFSIYELEKVINEKEQPLTDIKGRVSMVNIESLEKAMEKQENKGGQGAGQGE